MLIVNDFFLNNKQVNKPLNLIKILYRIHVFVFKIFSMIEFA